MFRSSQDSIFRKLLYWIVFVVFAFNELFIWRRAGLIRRVSSSRWDNFYPTFIWNLSSIKKFVISLKKIVWSLAVGINSDVMPLCRTNALPSKIYPALPGSPTCTCSDGKSSPRLGRISAKSNKTSSRRDGSLLIIFFQEFFLRRWDLTKAR